MVVSSVWPEVNSVYKEAASEQKMITTQNGNEEMRGAWAEQSHIENKGKERREEE